MEYSQKSKKFFANFNLGHFQDCFNTFTRIFLRTLTNDRMIVFIILDAIHITPHILTSLFMLIISVVRVKIFHISKVTPR